MQVAPQSERSRETRIGLVMYGGVSLAVYTNGVAQEFHNAVQGNGVYHLIKELTDSEITLDILSGSSAGGINAILLSYALTNGKDFSRCADLWRNGADIRRLLRAPSYGTESVRSVLDSEGYYQTELERAFRTLNGSPATGEAPSLLKELDLFVTGTDVDGRTFKRVDDAGHVIEVKDYRAVFQLKYRKGRKSNFDATVNPAVITALSKLARITSCFPGAFAPVFVSHTNIEAKNPSRMSANELLQYWGSLPGAAYLIDGGVIDNKPFTHTLREIFYRTTERKVDRKLYYVEPDPERFPERDADFVPEAPSFLKPVVNSLVTIPGYESIADDLKLLEERNEHIRRYQRILDDVLNNVPSPAVSSEAAGRGAAIPPEIPEPQKSIYTRARFASIRERLLEGVFKGVTFENSAAIRNQRTSLVREFDTKIWCTPGLMQDFDVRFRLRRTFHLIYHVYSLLYGKSSLEGDAQRTRYLELLKRLNSQMELYNVLQSAMDTLVDEADYGWRERDGSDAESVWKRVLFSLQQLLRSNELVEHLRDLQTLNRLLRNRIERYKNLFVGAPEFHSVLTNADALEFSFLQEMLDRDDPVFQRYLQFNAIDAYLFPLEWVSKIHEKDEIQTVRISPLDAQKGFSAREARDKTAGDSLSHFSAFFKRTWRSNDIMWGRLDGACELVETLLTEGVVTDAMNRDDARQRARDVLLPSDGSPSPLDRWFSDSSEAAVKKIKSWVEMMTDADPGTRSQAFAMFPSIQELLIEMTQFRILHECLPGVYEDSIREQVEWKQVRKSRDPDNVKLVWLGADVGIGGAALDAVAAVGGKQLLQEMTGGRPREESPKESPLGKSFSNFRVGSEEIAGGGVPFIVLSEIVLRALLVLRSCVLGMFSERTARRVRSSNLYRWGFEMPLRGLYGAVTFFRAAPSFHRSILIGTSILAILALLVGLKWSDAIVRPEGQIHFLWFGVFIIAPLAWLTAALYQLSRSRLREHFSDSVRNAFVAVCAAAPFILATMVYFGVTDLAWDWLWAWWSGTLEPADSRRLRLLRTLVILLYGVVPFVLSFIGGYMAVKARRRQPEIEDLAGALERLTESDLQDVSDRLGEQHQVTPENRRKIVKALTVAAEMNGAVGNLTRAIRAVSPGALE